MPKNTKTTPGSCEECKFFRACGREGGMCVKNDESVYRYDWCSAGRKKQ